MLNEYGITLVRSDFLNSGVCTYEDGYGNRAIFRRELTNNSDGFTARLKFKNEFIKAAPFNVTIPVKREDEGQILKVDYLPGGPHEGEDVDGAVKMFTLLVQRWIDMLLDIAFLQADPKFLLKANKNATLEDVANTKFTYIKDYEELNDLISFINGK